jgi:hypothetical protein
LIKLESPLPKDDLCQVWLKLALWFWRRSRKCKSLQTNDGQKAIRIAHLSFQLRWTNKNSVRMFILPWKQKQFSKSLTLPSKFNYMYLWFSLKTFCHMHTLNT